MARRWFSLLVATVIVAAGVLFTFFWYPVVRHADVWFMQGDLWGIYRGAQYVGWGNVGGVYGPDTGMVTLPGIAVVLAPVAMLSDTFHLSSSAGGFLLPRPSAAVLLVPVELILASTVVVAADALADELGVGRARRAVVSVVIGLMTWALASLWGHPEDALVMTFALFAMRAAYRGRWSRAAWLFGLGIAFQPLIALVVPLYLAASPKSGRVLFALRCSAISAFLVLLAFLDNASGTLHVLLHQPTPPSLNHATPWISLAPHEWLGASRTVKEFTPVFSHGRVFFAGTPSVIHPLLEIFAGPGRVIYLALALVAGLYVWRHPVRPDRLLWLAALVLTGRCYFEAVMTAYYVTPPLILLVVLAGRTTRGRLAAVVVLTATISWYAYLDEPPWLWWLPIIATLTALLALTSPASEPDFDEVQHGIDTHDEPVLAANSV